MYIYIYIYTYIYTYIYIYVYGSYKPWFLESPESWALEESRVLVFLWFLRRRFHEG